MHEFAQWLILIDLTYGFNYLLQPYILPEKKILKSWKTIKYILALKWLAELNSFYY